MGPSKPGRNGNGIVLEFNRDRAAAVLSLITRLWQTRDKPNSPFTGITAGPEVYLAPPELRPSGKEYGTLEHVFWLFAYAFINRNGEKATKLARRAAELWKQNQPLFDPRQSYQLSPRAYEPFRELIPYATIPEYSTRVGWWHDCLKRIHEVYRDDVRLVLCTGLTGSVLDDRRRIIERFCQEFPGIGPKIAQLLVGWLQETPWQRPPNNWGYVKKIPVVAADLWVGRAVRQLGIVTRWESGKEGSPGDHSQTVLSKVADFLARVCYEEGLCHTDCIQGLWHFFSVICGRKRPKKPAEAFARFCPSCPLSRYCLGIVPANYFVKDPGDAHSRQAGRRTGRLSSMRWDELIPRNLGRQLPVESGLFANLEP